MVARLERMDGMHQPLMNQKALVTGASSGIGKAVAIALGRAGADVVVNFRSQDEEAAKVVRTIRGFGVQAYAHRAEVQNERAVAAMFRKMIRRFGTVDILINNAGLQRDAAFEKMTLADWKTVLDVNLTGQFLCAREAVKEFRRRGVVKGVSSAAGKIICMSSVHDIIPWAGRVNYAAAKGGVLMFMRSLAQEVAQFSIRVNSISPGAIQTPINRSAWDTAASRRKLLKLIPYKRIGTPEDIGKAAVWLASDESDYVTGETLYVDGGMTLYPAFRTGG